MATYNLAIELGTSNTVIYVAGLGVALKEPSCIAIETVNKKKVVKCVGTEAKNLVGKTNNSVEVHFPICEGVIYNFQYAKQYSRIIPGKPRDYVENNGSVRIEGRNLSGVTKEYTETKNTPDGTGTIKSVSYCPFPYIVNNSYSEGEISVREYNKEQIQELVVKDGKPVRYILVDEKGRWPKIIKQYQMTEDGWKKVIG